MLFRLFADTIIIIHFLFILFVILGGLLSLLNRHWIYFHLPAVVWGVVIEFTGWICPLTPIENHFRHKGGTLMYEGGFVEHYLIPVIYPVGLTHEIQYILGALVVGINVVIYFYIFKYWAGRKKLTSPEMK